MHCRGDAAGDAAGDTDMLTITVPAPVPLRDACKPAAQAAVTPATPATRATPATTTAAIDGNVRALEAALGGGCEQRLWAVTVCLAPYQLAKGPLNLTLKALFVTDTRGQYRTTVLAHGGQERVEELVDTVVALMQQRLADMSDGVVTDKIRELLAPVTEEGWRRPAIQAAVREVRESWVVLMGAYSDMLPFGAPWRPWERRSQEGTWRQRVERTSVSNEAGHVPCHKHRSAEMGSRYVCMTALSADGEPKVTHWPLQGRLSVNRTAAAADATFADATAALLAYRAALGTYCDAVARVPEAVRACGMEYRVLP